MQDEEDKKDSSEIREEKEDKNEYEKICYICRRPEHITGTMVNMPGGMEICRDCMQKAFDSLGKGNIDLGNLSRIPFINLNISDINKMDARPIPEKQKIRKKDKKSGQAPLQMKDIPFPHIIKSKLDEYVIGQEKAKKVLSVAVYNHYKRIFLMQKEENKEEKDENSEGNLRIEKSNILMLGPTGSGKTYLVKTIARILKVPLAIADATSLTESGYIGDDIESVISKLLLLADNDVEKAECGIVFIDEIDKIAKKKNMNSRDVSGESVQQELLKLLEGSKIEVPVGANQKNVLTPMATVNTDNILFICGGAFPELEDIVKERLNKNSLMGFNADLKDKYDEEKDLLAHATIEDIRKFGMIPEFLGRLPIVVSLAKLDKEDLVKILKEPRNAILKQYIRLLELDEVRLNFDEEALEWIAQEAMRKNTGARALRSIIEEFMLDIMYEIPKDKNIGEVTINKAYLEKKGAPKICYRNY